MLREFAVSAAPGHSDILCGYPPMGVLKSRVGIYSISPLKSKQLSLQRSKNVRRYGPTMSADKAAIASRGQR